MRIEDALKAMREGGVKEILCKKDHWTMTPAVLDMDWEVIPKTAETFIPGIGTVRQCIDCGCLVGGGPTRCGRCAKDA